MMRRGSSHRRLRGVRLLIWVGLAAALGLTPMSVAQPASGSNVVSVKFHPAITKDQGHPLVFSFHGKQNDPPLWFLPTPSSGPTLSDSESFLRTVFETNRSGTSENVLALWNPEERPDIFVKVNDAGSFAKNQAFYGEVKRAAILAELLYGDYTIFVVLHSGDLIEDYVQPYPVLRSNDGFFLTNGLEDDPMLQWIYLVYEDKLLTDPTTKRGGP